LIHHIESLHAGFITILVTQLTWQLFNDPPAPGSGTPPVRDSSYDSFIAAWVVCLLDTQTLSPGDEGVNQGFASNANIIPVIMGGLGPLGLSTSSGRKTIKLFLRELCKRDSRLTEMCSIMESAPQPAQEWNDNDLEIMNERLGVLLAHDRPPAPEHALRFTPETNNGGYAASDSSPCDHDLPPGWSVPKPTSGWRPSPIGVYVPCA